MGNSHRFFEKNDRCQRIEEEIQRVIEISARQCQVTKANVDDVHLEIQLNAPDGRGKQPVPAHLIGHRECDERE